MFHKCSSLTEINTKDEKIKKVFKDECCCIII